MHGGRIDARWRAMKAPRRHTPVRPAPSLDRFNPKLQSMVYDRIGGMQPRDCVTDPAAAGARRPNRASGCCRSVRRRRGRPARWRRPSAGRRRPRSGSAGRRRDRPARPAGRPPSRPLPATAAGSRRGGAASDGPATRPFRHADRRLRPGHGLRERRDRGQHAAGDPRVDVHGVERPRPPARLADSLDDTGRPPRPAIRDRSSLSFSTCVASSSGVVRAMRASRSGMFLREIIRSASPLSCGRSSGGAGPGACLASAEYKTGSAISATIEWGRSACRCGAHSLRSRAWSKIESCSVARSDR